jgi:selenocysteine lyase/cysteine desulfurase
MQRFNIITGMCSERTMVIVIPLAGVRSPPPCNSGKAQVKELSMSTQECLVPRSDFPALEKYVYLNTASISLMPLPALQAMEEFERGILSAGTVSLDEAAEVLAYDGVRRAAARLLGVADENIAILSSCTEAMSQIAWGIRPQGNVVSIDIEHPSVVYPWRRVCQDTGAELRLVERWHDPSGLCLDDVSELIDSDTTAVVVSHAQYSTGRCLDLRRVADLAHSVGAICAIDASQSAGAVPIDAAASGVDAMVATSYKWLCGPFGAGILYLAPSLIDRFEPILVGWRSTSDMWTFDSRSLTYAPNMRRFEFCTTSYAAAYGLGKSMEYLLALSSDDVRRHGTVLGEHLIAGLDELGAEVISPRCSSERSSTVMARFPGKDGEKVAAELNRRGVIVSPRFGATRFSPHFFNTLGDIDQALETLKAILREAPGGSLS